MQNLTFGIVLLFFGVTISLNCVIALKKNGLGILCKLLSVLVSFGYAYFVSKGLFGTIYSDWDFNSLDKVQKFIWLIVVTFIAILSLTLFSLSGFFEGDVDEGAMWIGVALLFFFGVIGYFFLLGVFYEFNLLRS